MILKNKPWPEVGSGIDYSLLQDEWIPAPWINLGDWSVTEDYREACHQLALRLGDFLELKADDRLLELACGYGAGLRLWSKSFGVQYCDALEYRRECHDFIESDPPSNLDELIKMRAEDFFSSLFSGQCKGEAGYDAILCVDAAYHFDSLRDLLKASRILLKPGGRIGFHLFCLNSQKPLAGWLMKLFELAEVDSREFRNEEDLIREAQKEEFEKVEVVDMTVKVLGGFASFVKRRSVELGFREKLKPAWWKIRATAWLGNKVLREGWLKYVMVQASAR